MRVYFASDFGRLDEVEALAAACERDEGVAVVSRWHRAADPAERLAAGSTGGPADAEVARVAALRNLDDLAAADVVVILTTGSPARGGRHFETGVAYASGKRVVVAGPVEHAFHHLPGVVHVALADVPAHLSSMASSMP